MGVARMNRIGNEVIRVTAMAGMFGGKAREQLDMWDSDTAIG